MSLVELSVQELGVFFEIKREKSPSRSRNDGRHFAKGITRDWVLRGISFDVNPGETVAVLGENGAGKSTLLRAIEGKLRPDEGAITSASIPISMGGLMSGFAGNLTVKANLRQLAQLRGVSKTDLTAFTKEVLSFADLVEKEFYPYKTLSSGMKSRLGFSFAHIFDPNLLLIDEGLAFGDRWFKQRAETAIARYLSSGKTVLITGHSEESLQRSCSRGIVLRQGDLEFDGPIDSAIEAYIKR